MAAPSRFSNICSVALAVALLACSSPRQLPVVEPTLPPTIFLTIHVDDAFTDSELQLIHAAVISLNVQTHGAIQVELVAHLDTVRYWIPPQHWRLMRLRGEDDLTYRFDMRNARGTPDPIAGICVRASHDLYLVPDRVHTSEQFLSVAMHEMLHAVGLEHTGGSQSVMGEVLPRMAPVRLSDADRIELLRVTGWR